MSNISETEQHEDTNNGNPVTDFLNDLNTIKYKIQVLNSECKSILTIGKTLEKDFCKMQKTVMRKTKPKEDSKQRVVGFSHPSLLSETMYEFMNIAKYTLVPRKDVTQFINNYIDENHLRDTESREIIIPDVKLRNLLGSSHEEVITYFNLQHYIKHHFLK
jgi:hypothetical protein